MKFPFSRGKQATPSHKNLLMRIYNTFVSQTLHFPKINGEFDTTKLEIKVLLHIFCKLQYNYFAVKCHVVFRLHNYYRMLHTQTSLSQDPHSYRENCRPTFRCRTCNFNVLNMKIVIYIYAMFVGSNKYRLEIR